jgi:DNA-binding response OmpR family regulator
VTKILVVEDDPGWRDVLVEALNAAGSTVTAAEDGVQAIKLLGTTNFDMVIFDLNLPRLNGVEAIKRLRRTEPDMPLLAMTANTDPSLTQAVLEAGATDVVFKTLPLDEILEIISRYSKPQT